MNTCRFAQRVRAWVLVCFPAIIALFLIAVYPTAGKQVRRAPLAGTRRGPTHFSMTPKERADYRRWATETDEGKKAFAEVLRAADATVASEAKDVMACARAYLVTGDRRYVEAARDWLLYAANRWSDKYGTTKKRRPLGSGNGWIWGPHIGTAYFTDAPYVYDLIADALRPEDELRVRLYIKRLLDGLREWKVSPPEVIPGQGENKNMTAMTLGNWSPFAFAIGYDEFVDWILDHKPGGHRDGAGGLRQWYTGTMRDGRMWVEAPPYQWYVGMGTTKVANALWRYRRQNLWDMRSEDGVPVRGIIDGRVDLAFPMEKTGLGKGSPRCAGYGEAMTSWKDGDHFLVNAAGRYTWEQALRSIYGITKESRYGWFLSLLPDPPDDLPKDLTPPAAPCGVFPESGNVMLRADESPSYWTGEGLALMVRGGEYARTSPADAYGFRLHGAGRLLYPDWETYVYEAFKDIGWKRSTVKQNTVVVDARTGWFHKTIYRRSFDPDLKLASLRGSPHGHDRMERVFMMTREYVLDLFDVAVSEVPAAEKHFYGSAAKNHKYADWAGTSLLDERGLMPDSHTFDWMLRGVGRALVVPDIRMAPDEKFSHSGYAYRWIENVRKAKIGARDFYVDWVQQWGGVRPDRETAWSAFGRQWWQQKAGVRVRMIGEPGTTIYMGDAPLRHGVVDQDRYPEEVLKTLAVRRRGKRTLFAALHEPYKDRPTIRRFEYLARSGGRGTHSVGLRVVDPVYTDRLYYTFGLPGFTKDTAPDKRDEAAEHWPYVTIKTGRDPIERLTFCGHAYVRDSGGGMSIRGRVASFALRAPGILAASGVVLNGRRIRCKRAGAYLLYGSPDVEIERADELTVESVFALGDTVFPGQDIAIRIVLRNLSDQQMPGAVFLCSPGKARMTAGTTTKRLMPEETEKIDLKVPAMAVAPGDVARLQLSYGTATDFPSYLTLWPESFSVRIGSPVELSFPQKYVNISSDKGGVFVVRLTGRSRAPVKGRVELKVGRGLTARTSSREFSGLRTDRRTQMVFKITPRQVIPGDLVSVEAIVYVTDPVAGTYVADRATTDVAVGVTLSEVKDTHYLPFYRYGTDGIGVPRPREEWQVGRYDYVLARAPGYTVRVDRFSGCSRWIMDAAGRVRSEEAAYPLGRTRTSDRAYVVPQGLAWTKQATFKGFGVDSTTEYPTARFVAPDGKTEITYVFSPRTFNVFPTGPLQVGFPDVRAPGRFRNERIMPPAPKITLPEVVRTQPAGAGKNLFDMLKATFELTGYKAPEKTEAKDAKEKAEEKPAVRDMKVTFSRRGSIRVNLKKLRMQDTVLVVRAPGGLEVGKFYRVAMRMKHTGVANVDGITRKRRPFRASIGGINNLSPYNPAWWRGGTRNWFQVNDGYSNRPWQGKARDAKMEFRIHLPGLTDIEHNQTGTVWFDDFRIEEIPAP